MPFDNPFVSNPSASPWITTAPGPGIIRHQIKSQKRQQLLSEASALTPDQAELVKQLTDRELSPADTKLYGYQLSEGLRGFAQKYNENPFYAFSREGKETVAGLQRLVRDPKLIASERAFKQSEEDFKKVKDSHLIGLMDVHQGRIKVIDKDNGEIEEIKPENFDPNKHQEATIEELYKHKVGSLGFYNKDLEKIQPYSHSMEDPDKVIDQVQKWFSGLGQTQQEQFSGLLSRKTTSNASQIGATLDALYAKTGLSDQARNTIYSQYYTAALQSGQKPTRQGAEQALATSLSKIAEGHNIFKTDTEENPEAKAMRAQAAHSKEMLVPIAPWKQYASGNPGLQQSISLTGNGRNVAMGYNPLPKEYLHQSLNTYSDKDSKDTRPKMNVRDLRIFNKVDDKALFIFDQNLRKLVPLPEVLKPFMGEMVASPDFLADTFTIPGDHGTRELHGTTGQDVPGGDRTFVTNVKFQGNRSSAFGSQYADAEAALHTLGYDDDKTMTSGQYEEYKQNINNPDWKDEGISKNFFTSRNMFNFPLFAVYKDPDIMNDVIGGHPGNLENKQNLKIDFQKTSDATQGSNAIEENPLNKVKSRYATFGDLSK